jgi:hypothetical protein
MVGLMPILGEVIMMRVSGSSVSLIESTYINVHFYLLLDLFSGGGCLDDSIRPFQMLVECDK